MRGAKVKVLLISGLLSLSISLKADLIESSEQHLANYINYIDTISEVKVDILTSKKKLTRAKSKVNTNVQQQQSIKNQVAQINQQKQKLPSQIDWSKNKIRQIHVEINSIMQNYFPNASNITQAQSDLLANERRVNGRLDGLSRKLQELNDFDRPRIQELERKISNAQASKSTIRSNIKNLRSENQKIRQETQGLRSGIKNLKDLMDRPRALNKKIKDAEAQFKIANDKRIEKGKSCRGLSTVTNRVCRRWKSAKNKLSQLKDIKSGKRLRILNRELRKVMVVVDENREKIEVKKDRLQIVERRISLNTDELQNLQSEYNFKLAEIRREQQQLNVRLQNISNKKLKVSQVFSLQKGSAAHSRSLVKYENDLKTADKTIAKFKISLRNLKSSLPGLQQKKNQAQLIYNEGLALIADKKIKVADSRVVLEKSLLESPLVLGEREDTQPVIEDVIMESKRWEVVQKNSSSLNLNRSSCLARTKELSDDEAIELKLAIIKIKSEDDTKYSEPVVMITVDLKDPVLEPVPTDTDTDTDLEVGEPVVARDTLDDFFSLKATVSGKEYDFVLMPSVSHQKKRVFLSKLSEREELIKLILRKNNFPVVFSNEDQSEEATFSLRGSSNAISKGASSLAKSCGGITIH